MTAGAALPKIEFAGLAALLFPNENEELVLALLLVGFEPKLNPELALVLVLLLLAVFPNNEFPPLFELEFPNSPPVDLLALELLLFPKEKPPPPKAIFKFSEIVN